MCSSDLLMLENEILCQARALNTNKVTVSLGRGSFTAALILPDRVVAFRHATAQDLADRARALQSDACGGVTGPTTVRGMPQVALPTPVPEQDPNIGSTQNIPTFTGPGGEPQIRGRPVGVTNWQHYPQCPQPVFEKIVEVRRRIPFDQIAERGFIYTNIGENKDPLDGSDPMDPVVRFQCWQQCPDGCWIIQNREAPTPFELQEAQRIYPQQMRDEIAQGGEQIRAARKFSIQDIVFLRCLDVFWRQFTPPDAPAGFPIVTSEREFRLAAIGGDFEFSGPYPGYVVFNVTPLGPSFRYNVVPNSPLPVGFATNEERVNRNRIERARFFIEDQVRTCVNAGIEAEQSQFNVRSTLPESAAPDLPPADPRGIQTGATDPSFGNPFLGGESNPRAGQFPGVIVPAGDDGNGNGGLLGGFSLTTPALAGGVVGFGVGFIFT